MYKPRFTPSHLFTCSSEKEPQTLKLFLSVIFRENKSNKKNLNFGPKNPHHKMCNSSCSLQVEQQTITNRHEAEVLELKVQLGRLNNLVEKGNQALQQKAQVKF